MTTTFETKAAQIEAIRNGDLIAIRDWFDNLPQNEHAVAKLAVKVLLEKLGHQQQFEPMSKEDLVSKLCICESALRVVNHTLRMPIGQAMVVLAKESHLPKGTATAYDDEDVDMMMGITEITLEISGEKALDFVAELMAASKRKPSPRKRNAKD